MNFNEFIKRENRILPEETEKVREEKLHEWQGNIEVLYGNVKEILAQYIKAGEVSIEENDIYIREKLLGDYTAKEMVINLGRFGKYVKLTPVGTYVIGAHGRVDMSGQNGIIRLVLVENGINTPKVNVTIPESRKHNSNCELRWCFVTSAPRINYVPVSKDIFLEQLVQLVE